MSFLADTSVSTASTCRREAQHAGEFWLIRGVEMKRELQDDSTAATSIEPYHSSNSRHVQVFFAGLVPTWLQGHTSGVPSHVMV